MEAAIRTGFIIIWGTTFISTKVLFMNFKPVEILFIRFVMGFLALLLVCLHRMKRVDRKQEITFVLAGLRGICLYYLLENIALTYMMASAIFIGCFSFSAGPPLNVVFLPLVISIFVFLKQFHIQLPP